MAERPQDTTRTKREEAGGASAPAADAAKAAKPAGGNPWIPLLVTLITMPALAFATTKFILLPKVERAMSQGGSGAAGTAPAEAGKEGEKSEKGEKGGGGGGGGKGRVTVPMPKILVNVAGTMGTRYLMTSLTLVGTGPDFKTKIDENHDQLLDLVTGSLSNKTISDLEKPGIRNVIRSELLTIWNNALGGPVIQEIYITEMAIQ